jgi:F-type H+-transporting ATPase subunit gamma
MANLKELRARIASVRNTRKITSAMSRIAAARLRKAQNAVTAARPYGDKMRDMVTRLVGGLDPADPATAHPLLEAREIRRVAILALTADRGLCGGFNSNVNRGVTRLIAEQRRQGREVVLIAVGKKARSYFHHARQALHESIDAPTLDSLVAVAAQLSGWATDLFAPSAEGGDAASRDRVDAVYVVHNRFVSVLSQVVETVQLLPVPRELAGAASPGGPAPVCEPGAGALLAHLLPVYVESVLQQAIFDSIASEVAARRMAMDSATDNATQLIGELTLVYNRERQAAITKELMEIIGGAEALKG